MPLEDLYNNNRLANRSQQPIGGGRFVLGGAIPQTQLPLPYPERAGQPTPQQRGITAGLGRFAHFLTTPLINIPTLPGGVVGSAIEHGLEGLTSPLGLASTALIPVTGGGSTALGQLAARAGVGAASGVAGELTSSALPDRTPGVLKVAAPIVAGALAGGGVSKGLNTLTTTPEKVAAQRAAVLARQLEATTSPEARQLTEVVANAKLLNRQTAALRSPEYVKRGAIYAKAIDESNGSLEGALAAKSALSGAMPVADATPLRPQFTEDTVRSLVGQIRTAMNNNTIGPFTHTDAIDGLQSLMIGVTPTNTELMALEKVFGPGLSEAVLNQRGYWSKFGSNVMDAVNAPRAFMATADASAPLRQGILLIGHPKQFASSFGTMMRAMVDPKYANMIDEQLATRPLKALADQAGLAQTEFGTGIGIASRIAREEPYASRLVQNIPGIGSVVRGSERAYSTFLNKLRADIFDNTVTNWKYYDETNGAVGAFDSNRVKQLATFLNAATGRVDSKITKGTLGQVMNAAFFAPQLTISRFKVPGMLFNPSTDTEIRKLIAKDLGAFVLSGSSVLGLAAAAAKAGVPGFRDFRVELNPLSNDFGKGRFGGTRIDFWGGYQPMVRTITQGLFGERKTTTSGQIVPADRLQTIGNYVRGKLSPGASLATDIVAGQTFTGDQFTADPMFLGQQGLDRITPLVIQDTVNAMMEGGLASGLKAAPASFFGASTSTFVSLGDARDNAAMNAFNKMYRDLTQSEKSVVDQSPQVLRKEAEANGHPSDYYAALTENNQNALNEEAAIGNKLRNGQFPSQQAFATSLDLINRRRITQNQDAAKQANRSPLPAGSPMASAYQQWQDLFRQADYGADQEGGVITGTIDWTKFDALEADLFKQHPGLEAYVNDRPHFQHEDPQVKEFYDSKSYIRQSGYNQIVDDVFSKFASRARSLDVSNYGDLLAVQNSARLSGDVATVNRATALINAIKRQVDFQRKQMRRADPTLDRALLYTGRTTTPIVKGRGL